MLNTKDKGIVIFALEQYVQVLEKESNYVSRNNVLELIWQLEREGV
jgi:hypothetical protein